jgi:hypothetical protein
VGLWAFTTRVPAMTMATLNLVSNAPLRREALRKVERGMTWTELAEAAGMMDNGPRGHADTTRLKRRLGLTGDARTGRISGRVRYETAVRLARALELDPHEAGV